MIKSGLIGRSILASRSPWLHEEEARAQGLALAYTLFDFTDRGWDDDALASTLEDLRSDGYAGFNVTYPFKQAVIPLLDELAESARSVGAVNTVAIRDGRTIGHNTDMIGFRDALAAGLPAADLGRVLLLGAGGAGSAVASALLSLGVAELTIADLDHARGKALAQHLRARGIDAGRVSSRAIKDVSVPDVTGIVNATPIGMAAQPGPPIDTEQLRPDQWVADIVYFPLETALLRAAAARGCATLDGSGMVVRQAAEAFRIITGHSADPGRMSARFGTKTGG
ncbi:shikimate dehydrogenase [Sphingomonas guangdongensis]|uniref:Shikimate dehydrogenase (NADP(+)) n=1 Tax=Sphingomonas guangdongensis TaxID=1141890 RepID=A0A285QED7_9SPHN|nr:shikimate dehydrogenase [Sphingomonas guangdongensis]SOB78507.1 shikimate dehydrogenase [Sphingomonas guangdongensis]